MPFPKFGERIAEKVPDAAKEEQRKKMLAKTQKIVIGEMESKKMSADLKQQESFRKLALKYRRPIIFLRRCLVKKKKLKPAQLNLLKKRFRGLEKQLDSFLMTESGFLSAKTFEDASKIRMRYGMALSDKIILSVIDLEKKKLVPRGFTHDVFRQLDNKGRPRKDL